MPATCPWFYDPGTLLSDQLEAASKFYTTPPLLCGVPKPTPPPTLHLKMEEMGEFLGYCYNHEGHAPTMELVMRCDLVARYIGFLKARPWGTHTGCAPSTLLLSVRHLKFSIPFLACRGACPGVASLSGKHVTATKDWYKGLIPRFTQQAMAEGGARRPVADTSLATIWKHLDSKWANLTRRFEVCGCVMPPQPHAPLCTLHHLFPGAQCRKEGRCSPRTWHKMSFSQGRPSWCLGCT